MIFTAFGDGISSGNAKLCFTRLDVYTTCGMTAARRQPPPRNPSFPVVFVALLMPLKTRSNSLTFIVFSVTKPRASIGYFRHFLKAYLFCRCRIWRSPSKWADLASDRILVCSVRRFGLLCQKPKQNPLASGDGKLLASVVFLKRYGCYILSLRNEGWWVYSLDPCDHLHEMFKGLWQGSVIEDKPRPATEWAYREKFGEDVRKH